MMSRCSFGSSTPNRPETSTTTSSRTTTSSWKKRPPPPLPAPPPPGRSQEPRGRSFQDDRGRGGCGRVSINDARVAWVKDRPYFVHKPLGRGGFGQVLQVELLVPAEMRCVLDANGDFLVDGEGLLLLEPDVVVGDVGRNTSGAGRKLEQGGGSREDDVESDAPDPSFLHGEAVPAIRPGCSDDEVDAVPTEDVLHGSGLFFALKVQTGSSRRQYDAFVLEAERMKSFSNDPRVLRAYDVECDPVTLRVMVLLELAECDLRTFLEKMRYRLDAPTIGRIFRSAVEAMAAVQERGVVFDGKPRNFMLVPVRGAGGGGRVREGVVVEGWIEDGDVGDVARSRDEKRSSMALSATGEPATGDPATGEPATGEPATGEPATGDPDSARADTVMGGVSTGGVAVETSLSRPARIGCSDGPTAERASCSTKADPFCISADHSSTTSVVSTSSLTSTPPCSTTTTTIRAKYCLKLADFGLGAASSGGSAPDNVVWALGMMLFQMLHDGANPSEVEDDKSRLDKARRRQSALLQQVLSGSMSSELSKPVQRSLQLALLQTRAAMGADPPRSRAASTDPRPPVLSACKLLLQHLGYQTEFLSDLCRRCLSRSTASTGGRPVDAVDLLRLLREERACFGVGAFLEAQRTTQKSALVSQPLLGPSAGGELCSPSVEAEQRSAAENITLRPSSVAAAGHQEQILEDVEILVMVNKDAAEGGSNSGRTPVSGEQPVPPSMGGTSSKIWSSRWWVWVLLGVVVGVGGGIVMVLVSSAKKESSPASSGSSPAPSESDSLLLESKAHLPRSESDWSSSSQEPTRPPVVAGPSSSQEPTRPPVVAGPSFSQEPTRPVVAGPSSLQEPTRPVVVPTGFPSPTVLSSGGMSSAGGASKSVVAPTVAPTVASTVAASAIPTVLSSACGMSSADGAPSKSVVASTVAPTVAPTGTSTVAASAIPIVLLSSGGMSSAGGVSSADGVVSLAGGIPAENDVCTNGSALGAGEGFSSPESGTIRTGEVPSPPDSAGSLGAVAARPILSSPPQRRRGNQLSSSSGRPPVSSAGRSSSAAAGLKQLPHTTQTM